jgi:hypothetical protein
MGGKGETFPALHEGNGNKDPPLAVLRQFLNSASMKGLQSSCCNLLLCGFVHGFKRKLFLGR